MESKPRKRYTADFKAQAHELLTTGKPVSQFALRRENSLLKVENDILKKAAVILGTKTPANFGK